jgi:outer membrane cobalamin receptor
LWDDNFFAQARYKKQFSPKWTLQVQGKYNYSWNKYVDEGVEYVGGKQIDTNRQNEYYVSASVVYKPTSEIDVSLAQDGAINDLHTNGVNSPEPLRYTSLTALNARYRNARVNVLGTLVGTYIVDEVKSGVKPDARKRLTPAVSVSYRLLDDEQLYVRAMYKNTFRVPTFTDLYYLRVGNTSLRPEKATEYTGGITWSGCRLAGLEHLTLTVDGYFNRVSDKIIAFPSTYVWKMQNYGKVNIFGIDATLSTSTKINDKVSVALSANYSWQNAIDLTNKDAKNYKHQLPYTPEHSGNVSVVVEMPWVNVGYSVAAVGKRYYLAQNIAANEIKGYCEHTATLWREFKIKNTSLRVQAEVINLTDEQYDVIKYYPMPGRSWRLTGIFKF